MLIRQSTITVINFGPMLDKTDGVTLETAAGVITSLDHATTGILLSKNGGTLTIREQGGNFVATTYDAHGCYKVSLSAVDTGTLGRLRAIHTEPATYLAVWCDFDVIPATLYDTIFATQPAAAIKNFFNVAAPTGTVNSISGVAGAADGLILGSAANKLAVDAAGKVAVPDTQKVDVNTLKTQAVTCGAAVTINPSVGAATIQPTNAEFELRSLPAADYTVVTDLGTVQTGDSYPIVSSVTKGLVKVYDDMSKPGTAQTITAPADMALNSTVAKEATLAVVAGYIDTEIGTIDTVVDAIKVQTDKLTFTVANQVDANVQSINDTALTGNGSALTPWGPV